MATFCFDFVNTLAYHHVPTSERISKILTEKFGLTKSPATIEKKLRVFDEIYFFSSITMQTEESKREFYLFKNMEILKSLGISEEGIAKEIYYELTLHRGEWKLFPDALRTLELLAQRGHNLALATNFDATLKSIIHELGISKFFQVIQVSAEIGVEKPDSRFFSILKDQIQFKWGETYFVGDNRKLDYDPALESGFVPILLDPLFLHPSISRRVETLNEVLSVPCN
jgi:FMN phosphatase YigB (HAD superfamily)